MSEVKSIPLSGPAVTPVEVSLWHVNQLSPWTLAVDRAAVPVPDSEPMPRLLRIGGGGRVFHLWREDAETTVYTTPEYGLRLHVVDSSAVQ